MMLIASILVGTLFALSTYLMLQGSFVRILFGVILLGNAANITVLTMSGPPRGKSAPVVLGDSVSMVDPLPHALVLTAIGSGFGVAAYLLCLLYRIFLDWKTTEVSVLFAKDLPTDNPPAQD